MGKSVEIFYEISILLVDKIFLTKFLPIRYVNFAETKKYYQKLAENFKAILEIVFAKRRKRQISRR